MTTARDSGVVSADSGGPPIAGRVSSGGPVSIRRAMTGIVCLLGVIHLATVAEVLSGGGAAGLGPSVQLRLDPNTASADELMLLPGIGPALAENIIAYRDAARDHPAFRSPADLDAVKRIGPATVVRLAPFLTFPGEEGRPSNPGAARRKAAQ